MDRGLAADDATSGTKQPALERLNTGADAPMPAIRCRGRIEIESSGEGMPSLAEVLAEQVREGVLWETLDRNRIRCYACGHCCPIPEGQPGVCKVRFNRGGKLYVPWGYVGGVQCDPIEKKPFLRSFPSVRQANTVGIGSRVARRLPKPTTGQACCSRFGLSCFGAGGAVVQTSAERSEPSAGDGWLLNVRTTVPRPSPSSLAMDRKLNPRVCSFSEVQCSNWPGIS
jgi:hypothetical protein